MSDGEPDTPSRWQLIRDVAVFQLKLAVDALRDVALVPVSLVAAALDLLSSAERPGQLFYDVLHVGRRSEEWINLFGEADRTPSPLGDREAGPGVDALVERLETMLVEQVERGGITAAAKQTIDRSLDAFSRSAQRPALPPEVDDQPER